MTAEGSRSLDNEACVDPADDHRGVQRRERQLLDGDDAARPPQPKISPDLLVTKSAGTSGPVTPGDRR